MTINWTRDLDDIRPAVGQIYYVVGRGDTGPSYSREPEIIEYAAFDDREAAIEAIIADSFGHGDLTWTRPDTTAVADDGYGWSIAAVTERKAS
jgi:hypothetical protein